MFGVRVCVCMCALGADDRFEHLGGGGFVMALICDGKSLPGQVVGGDPVLSADGLVHGPTTFSTEDGGSCSICSAQTQDLCRK